MEIRSKQFNLFSSKCWVDGATTKKGAFVKAVFYAKQEGIRIFIHDSMAYPGQPELWEVRPFEDFGRVRLIKPQEKAA